MSGFASFLWILAFFTTPLLALSVTDSGERGALPQTAREDDAPVNAEWDEATEDLQDFYGIDRETARVLVESQGQRLQFREAVVAALRDTFAGFRFDVHRSTQVVLVTNIEQSKSTVDHLAASFDILTEIELAQHSYAELEAMARRAEAGALGIHQDDVVSAVPNDNRNLVIVYVSHKKFEQIDASIDLPAGYELSFDDDEAVVEACTGTYSCGGPLRGGIGVWRNGFPDHRCSLGYSATGNDGSRWAIIAGHCVETLNQTFGHGAQFFGPARQFTINPPGPTVAWT